MKAYLASVENFDESECIVAAETRAKAKYRVFLSSNDAGYRIPFSRIRAVRAPEYDPVAGKIKHCVGLVYAKLLLDATSAPAPS